jgi:hypothetical protein
MKIDRTHSKKIPRLTCAAVEAPEVSPLHWAGSEVRLIPSPYSYGPDFFPRIISIFQVDFLQDISSPKLGFAPVEISGSDSDEFADYGLLGCCTV